MARLSENLDFDGRPLVICDCDHKLAHHRMWLIHKPAPTTVEYHCSYVGCDCKLTSEQADAMQESARCAA